MQATRTITLFPGDGGGIATQKKKERKGEANNPTNVKE
jgi:hypothetical protein